MIQVVGGNEDCTDGEGGGADGDLAGGRLTGMKIWPLDSTAPHNKALERDDEPAVASFVILQCGSLFGCAGRHDATLMRPCTRLPWRAGAVGPVFRLICLLPPSGIATQPRRGCPLAESLPHCHRRLPPRETPAPLPRFLPRTTFFDLPLFPMPLPRAATTTETRSPLVEVLLRGAFPCTIPRLLGLGLW